MRPWLAAAGQGGDQLVDEAADLRLVLGALEDRDDGRHVRRDPRREDQPLVVAVGHDERADQPGAYAPARRVRVRLLLVPAEELDLERLGEVLAQIVAGAALQRLAVLHQRLDAVGDDRPGELLGVGLLPLDHRDGQHVLREVGVDVEHLQRLLPHLRRRLVGGVAIRT